MAAKHRREISIAITIVALWIVMAFAAPSFFTLANQRDVLMSNMPVLIAALGMTLIVLTGQIDISIGSQFAICSVAAGLAAKSGLPLPAVALAVLLSGALLGAINGALVAWARIPSIVVTLAAMVALRDALRWVTQGAWGLRNMPAGRAVYAVGSNENAARLAGIDAARVTFWAFTAAGALTACAALLNSARFNQIPSNAGLGMELKVIAAVVVGGTAIRGGRGTVVGTLLGVILLGAIGPALTFLGISAYWEKAIQGAIILMAVATEAWPLHARILGDRFGHSPA